MKRREFLQKAGGVSAAGASVIALPAPAIARRRKEMVILSSFARDAPGIGTGSQRLAKRIEALSEGAIKTIFYAAGEKVGPFDVFDEVVSGNADAYVSGEYYWKGKHPAFAYFTTVPFGMTFAERSCWIQYAGGQDLWDEVSGNFGLKALPCGATGTQMAGWFNKKINSIEDFNGLKMRIPGLGGDVMAKLGVSPISLPGTQVYESIVNGTIDAIEWMGPYADYYMKLYEAAKYYYYPGMHEPDAQQALGMNKAWWSGLTPWEQTVITTAALEQSSGQYFEIQSKNGYYLKKMIEENGITLRRFDEEIFDAFGEAAKEVMQQTRDYDALTAKVHDHFTATLQEIGYWQGISEVAYVTQRNRVLGFGD